mmetsp:Transcript_10635/g.14715  ORF Transcript_10635/g.14715 Transcript_10635/m.14715 type:complete len:283 (-) Transcript_10635:4809-5657(-)
MLSAFENILGPASEQIDLFDFGEEIDIQFDENEGFNKEKKLIADEFNSSVSNSKAQRKRKSTFTVGLYRLLQEEPNEIHMGGNGELIIINPSTLEPKLPTYFNTKNYTSFQRQLNNFGYVKHDWRDCTRQNSVYLKRRGPSVLKPSDILALSPVPTNPDTNKRKRGRSVPPPTAPCANSILLKKKSTSPTITTTAQAQLPQTQQTHILERLASIPQDQLQQQISHPTSHVFPPAYLLSPINLHIDTAKFPPPRQPQPVTVSPISSSATLFNKEDDDPLIYSV